MSQKSVTWLRCDRCGTEGVADRTWTVCTMGLQEHIKGSNRRFVHRHICIDCEPHFVAWLESENTNG